MGLERISFDFEIVPENKELQDAVSAGNLEKVEALTKAILSEVIEDSKQESKQESKITPQQIYHAYFALGRAVLQKKLQSEISISHGLEQFYFAKAHAVVIANKELKPAEAELQFIKTLSTLHQQPKKKLSERIVEEVEERHPHLSSLQKISQLAVGGSKEALCYFSFIAQRGPIELQILAAYLLQNMTPNSSLPKLNAHAKKILEKNKVFMQGLSELVGWGGFLVNERKAIINFEKSINIALDSKQIDLCDVAYVSHVRLYIVECHRRLAEKIAKVKQKNPQERLTKAILVHKALLKEYNLLPLEVSQRIFISIFKLLQIADDKRAIILLLLDNINEEIRKSKPSEILLNDVLNTLFSIDCVRNSIIWKDVINKLNQLHKETDKDTIRALLVNQMIQLKNQAKVQDAEHQYYINKALGDCFSRVKTKESLITAINYYEAARANHTTAAGVVTEKFLQASYCEVYADLGDAITRLRDNTKTAQTAEELRKEAIAAYNTATSLGDPKASLDAAKLIELDEEGTDDAIAKYQTTMQDALKTNDASRILLTLQEVMFFKQGNDLEDEQNIILKVIFESALDKLRHAVFVEKYPEVADGLYKLAKKYHVVTQSSEPMPRYVAYSKYYLARKIFKQYEASNNIAILEIAAATEAYLPAILMLLSRNLKARGWFHTRQDRPLILSTVALLKRGNESDDELIVAKKILDSWANRSVEDLKPGDKKYQRIKIAKFCRALIEECRVNNTPPTKPSAFILQRAAAFFKDEKERLILNRLQRSLKNAYQQEDAWLNAQLKEETGVPVPYTQPPSIELSVRPAPEAVWEVPAHAPSPLAPPVPVAAMHSGATKTADMMMAMAKAKAKAKATTVTTALTAASVSLRSDPVVVRKEVKAVLESKAQEEQAQEQEEQEQDLEAVKAHSAPLPSRARRAMVLV